MAFNDDETSVQDGSPIELYEFVGTYNTYRLTNWGRDIVNSLGTFDSSFAITRSDAEEGTQEDDDISIDVEIDASHPVVAEYVIQEPPPSLNLRIYRVHPNDLDDFIKFWDGEVTAWSLSGRIAKAHVPSLFSFLFDAPLPRPRYQNPCNHVFGDEFCGLDLTTATFSDTTTLAAVNGTTLEVASQPFADGQLVNGELVVGDERRRIITHVGNVLTVASRFTSQVVPALACTVIRGCNHAYEGDCLLYNNQINYGGFPFVPTRNPFNSRL